VCGRLCKLPACDNFNNGRVRWLVKQHTCRAYCQAGRARRSQQILSLRRCPCWIGLLLHVIVLSGGASRCACIMLIGFSCVCRGGVTCMRRLVQCVCPGTKSASLPAVTPRGRGHATKSLSLPYCWGYYMTFFQHFNFCYEHKMWCGLISDF